MTFIPVMWTVWGGVVAISVIILMYRSSLTRDEDDQIYLDEAFAHEKAAQEAIVAKVNRLEPTVRLSLRITAVVTLFVAVYSIVDMVRQFR